VSRYGRYESLQETASGWLGEIPSHWTAKRLKHIADTSASNVDKKSKDGEPAVRLCNYTDVYYNDRVTSDLDYMTATASVDQIKKFTLRAGDTIITKDSEGPDDIAIPTFVPADLPGVICGYHLSIVRPRPFVHPRYLNHTFKCHFARAYFATRANGLTRYGLGSQALGDVVFPVPPASEQVQIARFLDYETEKIDALIEKQQQLIALLKEKRQAVISHAVTKGLNPDAPLRDSGVEWLGMVPAHWEVMPLKHRTQRFEQGWSPQCDQRSADPGEWGVLKVGCVNGGVFRKEENKALPPNLQPRLEYHLRKGDLLISRANTRDLVGSAAVVHENHPQLLLCDKLYRLRLDPTCSVSFVSYFLGTAPVREQIELAASGASDSMQNIGQATIKELPVPIPPLEEGRLIAHYLEERLASLDKIHALANAQIELLQERRTALISAAVTGKIDVRAWAPRDSNAEQDVA
jgi:type I restriction enzyme S subunit